MRVHHLDCGTMCPYSERLINGTGSMFAPGRMVCHCLLVEGRNGLVLVDTGLGRGDLADPAGRLGAPFVAVTRPTLRAEQTAVAQVEALGFRASDVQDIVVTHLDLDHAGGLSDFPTARVHVFDLEHQAATRRATVMERNRYREVQWQHGPTWVEHGLGGERWKGFEVVRALGGTEGEVLLVPLHGHTRGHCAVAVSTDRGWLLHCGDAYFHHDEVHRSQPRCPTGLALFQRIVAVDDDLRRLNQARLREFARLSGHEVSVFCAHDPGELAALADVN